VNAAADDEGVECATGERVEIASHSGMRGRR
jgi:hypothetical protein